METRLGVWGNSYAVRIPAHIVADLGWSEGENVKISRAGRKIVLENPSKSRLIMDWKNLTQKQKQAMESYYLEHVKGDDSNGDGNQRR